MEYGKLSVLIAGTAKGKEIFTALKIHFLFKGNHALASRLCVLHIHPFVHGIGSCDLGSLDILKGKGHNRLQNAFIKMDAHFNLEGSAFLYGIAL